MKLATLSIVLGLFSRCLAEDWTQFRGPDGQGHSNVKKLPLKWSDNSDNLTWKARIDGLGWSSPVVSNNQIWLTTATDQGRSLRAVCLDAKTGRELHNVQVFRKDAAGRIHRKNSHASPTPILDGDRVYIHFGTYGTACLSTDGKVLWRQTIRYNHVHGPGGFPELVDGLLIINCDGGNKQTVVGLDKDTGKIRWQTPRVPNTYGKKFAFSTPLAIDVNGRQQVVSPGASGVTSYQPKTGKSIWHVTYTGGYSVVPRPVYGHGLVFLSTGFDRPTVLAIRTNGMGDVTNTHVAWKLERGAPHSPSPLLIGDELYLISDRGIATCLEAKSGKVLWQERIGGNFSASPLYAAGRIHLLDENGATTIIEPGKTYTQLAKNEITGRTLASLVPIEGALLLRTDTQLYRIEAE
ncbi:MAG: PQQ-like beta-propeller repeat protein [Planctomycetes bacterium]|nr:PQQ-like beta-propeller repeat protein [Planctomycetota bacterium]